MCGSAESFGFVHGRAFHSDVLPQLCLYQAALSIDVMEKTTGRVFPDPMPRPGEDGCHHLVTVPGACAGWGDAIEKWGTMNIATYAT